MVNKWKLILKTLRIYWKSTFIITYPLILLPVFIIDNTPEYRCLYVVLLMAGFWVFEALPLAVTSLIPMALFPLMGILDSNQTSLAYMKETNMMFVGGLIIAVAVEYCNLHTRMALHVIKLVGCSPRRLNLGLVTVTMLVSMWISNTAATAMMIPIIQATLKELEDQGLGNMYEPESLDDSGPDNENRRPTKMTMCYFISTAYAASIGGAGTIVGSGTNLTFKGIYETKFKKAPGIEFTSWMALNVPMMLVTNYLAWVWLQFYFMGLCRPKSTAAQKIQMGKEGTEVARKVILKKIEEMGPMSFHEIAVGLMFLLSACLWFFRQPQFIKGWAEVITQHKVKDATAAMIVVILLFVIPAKPDFIYALSRDKSKRPKAPSSGLITWKIVQQKLSWGLVFLLGGGFALAEGTTKSGMSMMAAKSLEKVTLLPPFTVMAIACILGAVLTQFSSNVATANVLLPVLAEMARQAKIHPLYLMLPTSLCCSFAYTMPVSTPPNAIAAGPCNMPSIEMVKAGFGVLIISLAVLFAIFPFLADAIWDMDTFPDWAENITDTLKLK